MPQCFVNLCINDSEGSEDCELVETCIAYFNHIDRLVKLEIFLKNLLIILG